VQELGPLVSVYVALTEQCALTYKVARILDRIVPAPIVYCFVFVRIWRHEARDQLLQRVIYTLLSCRRHVLRAECRSLATLVIEYSI